MPRMAVTLLGVGLLCCINAVSAADWTTYRGGNERAGATDESIATPLNVAWSLTPPAEPRVAWSDAGGRVIEGKLLGNRVSFDDAFHPVVADGKVYFGSTVDHQLHCVDLATGERQWSYFTGGPIRLAPTIDSGRVHFGSDDGRVYCLDAATGAEVWQLRAGPADEWLLARGEMICRWPVRTGVLIDGGIAYFGAGIFPHEDVYLYAVDAATGSIVWKQDNISAADAGRDDLSPQGYLLATDDLLFVPSGRSLPAAFDRTTGELIHKRTFSWRTTAGGVIGGTQALLADGQLYTSGPHHMLAIDQKSGDPGFGWFAGRQIIVQGDAAYVATGTAVARLDRMEYAVNSRRRHELETEIYNLSRQVSSAGDKIDEVRAKLKAATEELESIADVGIAWQVPTEDDAALLAAGNLVLLGGPDRVTAYAADDGAVVWQHEVNGSARGLVVSDNRLLVSTNKGLIYCFSPDGDNPEVATAKPSADGSAAFGDVAEQILAETGARNGFCLVVGSERGDLAIQLALRSNLKIYGIEPDADKVVESRRRLADAGLYGRVVIHQADYADIPYSNYFANLIVSESQFTTGDFPISVDQVARHLKPVGGVLCLQNSGDATIASLNASDIAKEAAVRAAGKLALLERGPLPGAGNWTHQYGNPANTAISDDMRVSGGLGVLWYGDPGPGEMVNRHEGAVGPLSVNGRLFVQGEHTIKAYDAYNGLHLWTFENEEALRTGVFQNQNPGNLAAVGDSLFHFLGGDCYQLDAATGEVVRIHKLPEGKDGGEFEWGYLAIQDGLLFGTATKREQLAAAQRRRGRVTEDATDSIFAIDLTTGEHLWSYHGGSISHHTIAIGPEQVFFIDSSITSEQRAEILRQDKTELENLTGKEREIAEERLKNADVRMATALDSRTGEKLWDKSVDVTDCSEIGIGGGKLTLMYQNGVLILCGANANGHYWRQFVAGEFERRRMVALSAEDGYKLWAKDANYRHRPIIVGEKVLAEPWMFDLHTGEQLMREHPITGEQVPWSIMRTGHHCGMLTGADSGMIMFRSGYTGFFDLNEDEGVRHFAGHRLGCWINAIPANGLVMIPEASAGCVCLFSIASTIVMEPREARRPWTIYSAVGSQTPVQHLAVNLGAPGDRKDARGTVWLSYPRYKAYQETSLDIKLDVQPKFAAGGGLKSISEQQLAAEGTDAWIYTSWGEGLQSLNLPLLGADDQPAKYTIRLHLADLREDRSTPALFDVQMNGKTVLSDVVAPAAGSEPTVATIEHVQVEGDLLVEFTPRDGTTVVVNAIEAIREK